MIENHTKVAQDECPLVEAKAEMWSCAFSSMATRDMYKSHQVLAAN